MHCVFREFLGLALFVYLRKIKEFCVALPDNSSHNIPLWYRPGCAFLTQCTGLNFQLVALKWKLYSSSDEKSYSKISWKLRGTETENNVCSKFKIIFIPPEGGLLK